MSCTTRATPACLPGPRFKDTVVSAMSGYGRYLRDNGQTCQTDGNGPMKYHYCAKRGGGDEVCHGGRPPRTKECRKFFNSRDTPGEVGTFTDSRGDEVQKDVILVERTKSGRLTPVSLCSSRRQLGPRHGWCPTSANYYHPSRPTTSSSWGYCSRAAAIYLILLCSGTAP